MRSDIASFHDHFMAITDVAATLQFDLESYPEVDDFYEWLRWLHMSDVLTIMMSRSEALGLLMSIDGDHAHEVIDALFPHGVVAIPRLEFIEANVGTRWEECFIEFTK